MAGVFSKRELEGYIEINHKDSPGLEHPLLGKGQVFRAATYTCPYCEGQVVVNPLRARDREYCRKLDRYICDSCGAKRKLGIDLKPWKQVVDEYLNAVHRNSAPNVSRILRP
ncbi:MAG: hypothetical protein AB7U95_03175 [Reyranella sp.]